MYDVSGLEDNGVEEGDEDYEKYNFCFIHKRCQHVLRVPIIAFFKEKVKVFEELKCEDVFVQM